MTKAREKRLLCELTKIRREINTHGDTYSFFRYVLDADGENTGQSDFVTFAKGLFHESESYATRQTTQGSETHSKNEPLLLCEYDKTKDIKSGDYVYVKGIKHIVVTKTDISAFGIVNDISLEAVQDGNSQS